MAEVMLWGPPTVPSGPLDASFRGDLELWMRQAVDSGVKRIIGGNGTRTLTEVANANGIELHPYVNYNSFPRHGSARETFGWSLDFLRPPLGSDEARRVIDAHRPIYDNPKVATTV